MNFLITAERQGFHAVSSISLHVNLANDEMRARAHVISDVTNLHTTDFTSPFGNQQRQYAERPVQ
jgi:hypothetical protein